MSYKESSYQINYDIDFETINDSLIYDDMIIYKTKIGSAIITILPLYLEKKFKKIFVIYPENNYVVNQYYFVEKNILNKITNKELKPQIKYVSDNYKSYGEKSTIIYVTGDYFINNIYKKYINNPLGFFKSNELIILNEADNIDYNYSLILLLIDYSRRMKLSYPKIILVSSVEIEKKEIEIMENQPYIYNSYEIMEREYIIEYIDPKNRYNKEYYDTIIETIEKASKEIMLGRCILVYLPNENEIKRINYMLQQKNISAEIKEITERSGYRYEDIRGDIEEKKVLIILTMDIADSEILIDEIDIIIDSMFETFTRINEIGSTLITKRKITDSLAKKRIERLGEELEVKKKCYRIISEREKEKKQKNKLYYKESGEKNEQLYYYPLSNILLDMIKIELPYREVLITLEPEKINKAIEELIKYEMIIQLENNKYNITDFGIFMKDLDLTPTNGKILQEVYQNIEYRKNIFGTIGFLSIIECWGPIYLEHIEEQSELQKKKEKVKLDTDMETYLLILQNYLLKSGTLEISPNYRINKTLSNNMINIKKITIILEKMRNIIRLLNMRDIKIIKSVKTFVNCIKQMKEILPKYYESYTYNVEENFIIIDSKLKKVNITTNNYSVNKPDKIIPLGNLIITNVNNISETIVGLSFY